MNFLEEYKLSEYQEYGLLGSKENIYLVRNRTTGKIGVKKILDRSQGKIIEFRKNVHSQFFPELEKVIETENGYIIIEQYVEGITLEEFMMGEPLEEAVAERFAVQICRALMELHNHEPMIIYRDLKPENIMVCAENRIKLIDFDISRYYHEGKNRDTELFGTAEYAAPEQFGYFQTDNRTDIYAFGIVLNYMLTAKFPVECIAEGGYEKVIRKCIELEPAKRYQKVEEILKEFHEVPVPLEEKEEKKNDSWVLPGFRSRTIWKEITAVLGYGMLVYLGLTLEFSDNGVPYTPVKQWITRLAFFLSQFLAILVIFDYRGISKGQKKLWASHKILGVAAAIGISLAFFCIGIIITAMIEDIFHL